MRVIALLLALGGCGLTMTRGPGQFTDSNGRPRCTTSMSAPQKDGAAAMVGLVAIVFGGVSLDAADNSTVGAPLLIGGLLTMAVAYASGGVGYYRIKKCRKATDEFDRAHPTSPTPVGPTPAAPYRTTPTS